MGSIEWDGGDLMELGRLAATIKKLESSDGRKVEAFIARVSSVAGGRIQINDDTTRDFRRLEEGNVYAVNDTVLGLKWGRGQGCIIGIIEP
jgi:hypothetical protein